MLFNEKVVYTPDGVGHNHVKFLNAFFYHLNIHMSALLFTEKCKASKRSGFEKLHNKIYNFVV